MVVRDSFGLESEDRILFEVNNIEILFPMNNDILRAGDIYEFIGTINYNNINEFKIEYTKGLDPNNWIWISDGITLTDTKTSKFKEGILGTWDTSKFNEPDFYTVRFTININKDFE